MGRFMLLFYLVYELLQLWILGQFSSLCSMNQLWLECLVMWQQVIMFLLVVMFLFLYSVFSLLVDLKVLFLLVVFVQGMLWVLGMWLLCSMFFCGQLGMWVILLENLLGFCMFIIVFWLLFMFLRCVCILLWQVCSDLLCCRVGQVVVVMVGVLVVILWFLVIYF